METQSIGKNLVYQRKLKGYTQDKLSEKSDVTIRTIQRIEKDDVTPQLNTIKLLADALEIDMDDLLILQNPKHESVQKKWLLFIHSSPMLGFIFPFSVLFPLFLWLHKRDDNPVYNIHGIKVINFQLSVSILYVLAFVSLVTIEKWGFFFFMTVVPFSFLTIIYNTLRAITSQQCFYPLSYPFLKVRKVVSVLFISGMLVTGCSSLKEKSQYEILLDYEGKYEYIDNTTLELKASELDTILYAVINEAKYPLKFMAVDSFTNMQGASIIFGRDASNEVAYYDSGGQLFKLITKNIQKTGMLPRKELFHNPDDYRYRRPNKINDGLETGLLEDEFKNPEFVVDMVKQTITGNFPEVHSILIYKNNKLVLEEYFYGHHRDKPHQLRSATKPLIGGIVGIAVDQGFIKSERDKLLPYFKSRYQEVANLDNNKNAITIEDFLMYRHGLDCDDRNQKSKGNEMSMMESEDWVKFTLDLPMISESGKSSLYCTGCALTLGSLVEIATGNSIENFASKNLFEPMKIFNYVWDFEPNKASMTNFSQLKLTSRDMVKLAKMYKDNGKWKGKQIISEGWVNKTFSMEDGDYGYMWYEKYFDTDEKRYSSYQASGNGGQKINIWPELDMITVFTGGNYNSYQLYGKSTPPNRMIPNYILKASE